MPPGSLVGSLSPLSKTCGSMLGRRLQQEPFYPRCFLPPSDPRYLGPDQKAWPGFTKPGQPLNPQENQDAFTRALVARGVVEGFDPSRPQFDAAGNFTGYKPLALPITGIPLSSISQLTPSTRSRRSAFSSVKARAKATAATALPTGPIVFPFGGVADFGAEGGLRVLPGDPSFIGKSAGGLSQLGPQFGGPAVEPPRGGIIASAQNAFPVDPVQPLFGGPPMGLFSSLSGVVSGVGSVLGGVAGAVGQAAAGLVTPLLNVGVGALNQVVSGAIGGSSGGPGQVALVSTTTGLVNASPASFSLGGGPPALGAGSFQVGPFGGGAPIPQIGDGVANGGMMSLGQNFIPTRSALTGQVTGARAQTHVVQNPVSGAITWFKPAGRPILWSGDLQSCKRVNKIARRARRAKR